MNIKRQSLALCFSFIILCGLFTTSALAVPETNAVRVTDVTASSFSLVWMTDVITDPEIEVYSDSSMLQRISEGLLVTPMPAGSSAIALAARTKGIMKVRVSGAQAATTYYVRTVTKDPADPLSIGYSALQEVKTASSIALYRTVSNAAQGLVNDLLVFPVYLRPADAAVDSRLGDLAILQGPGSPYPVSAFVGDGAVSPEGVIDLNNLFGMDGTNLAVIGGEVISLRIYRGGGLATLTHYRRTPQNSAVVSVLGPIKGFFADSNLDGKIDDTDFQALKVQYRTTPNDASYNPDYYFVSGPTGTIDVRNFGKFSKEYGRTNVE